MRCLSLILAACCVVMPAAHAEKTLRYAFPTAETGFDPAQLNDLYSRDVTANIFDAPLRQNWLSHGEVEPNTLSAMPEISADFKTFTFHLKPGIYFTDDAAFHHQKRELVAEDYVYSLKRIYDPHWTSPSYGTLAPYGIPSLEALRNEAIKTGHFNYDKPVEGIRTLDRYTWQVHLESPAPRFATTVYLDPSVFGAVAREVVETYGDQIMAHPVGTGPFMLSDWVRSSKIVLVRNPTYRTDLYHAHPRPDDLKGQAMAAAFDGRAMPFVDRIEISIIDESQPRYLAFLNGELDLLEQVPIDLAPLALPNNQLAPNLRKKNIVFERVPQLRTFMVLFNVEDPLLGGYSPDKVALRRAIGLGLNVPELIANVAKYEAIPAQSVIYPGQYGYDPNLRTEMGTYDVARANAMLDAYGYRAQHDGHWRDQPDGTPLVVTYLTNPNQVYRSIDEIIKKSMDALGIRIEIRSQQWAEDLKAAQAGHFTMWFLGESSTDLDPDGGFALGYGPGKGGTDMARFELPQYDELYRKQSTLPDGPERLATLVQLRNLLNAYEPYKFTWNPFNIVLNYPWVKDYRADPLIQDWWRYVDIDPVAQQPWLR